MQKNEYCRKEEKNRGKKTECKYKNKEYCVFIDIVYSNELKLYYNFIKEHIRYFSVNYQKYKDNLYIKELYNLDYMKNWILSKIDEVTHVNDIIIFPFINFGIKLQLIDVNIFFQTELKEKISNHIGLDIGFINITQKTYLFFSDEEDYIFEYYKEWG